MGPPPADEVGLNTQHCLTSGILGLPLGKDKSTRQQRDKDKETIALVKAMLKSGIAVTVTTTEPHKGTIVYKAHTPAVLQARGPLPIHAAARKELRLDMPLNTRATGVLLFEHKSTAVQGSIRDMLVLARYDLRSEVNGFSSPLLGNDGDHYPVNFVSESGSDLLAIIDHAVGKAPLEALLPVMPHWVTLERLTALAGKTQPSDWSRYDRLFLFNMGLGLIHDATRPDILGSKRHLLLAFGVGKEKRPRQALYLPPPKGDEVGKTWTRGREWQEVLLQFTSAKTTSSRTSRLSRGSKKRLTASSRLACERFSTCRRRDQLARPCPHPIRVAKAPSRPWEVALPHWPQRARARASCQHRASTRGKKDGTSRSGSSL